MSDWNDVLIELHDRFDALEKEIRKASAEMSAVIREYVDRPKGEQIAIGTVCEVICKHCIKANGCCQHHWICPLLTEIAELIESKDEPQTNADQHVQRVEYVGNDEKSRCWTCKHFERMHETPISSDGSYYTYVVCTVGECRFEPKDEQSGKE